MIRLNTEDGCDKLSFFPAKESVNMNTGTTNKPKYIFRKACAEIWKEHMVTRKMINCRERPNLHHYIAYVLNVLSRLF